MPVLEGKRMTIFLSPKKGMSTKKGNAAQQGKNVKDEKKAAEE